MFRTWLLTDFGKSGVIISGKFLCDTIFHSVKTFKEISSSILSIFLKQCLSKNCVDSRWLYYYLAVTICLLFATLTLVWPELEPGYDKCHTVSSILIIDPLLGAILCHLRVLRCSFGLKYTYAINQNCLLTYGPIMWPGNWKSLFIAGAPVEN